MTNQGKPWWLYLLLIVPGTLWGSGFLLNEIALRSLPFVTITTLRVIIAVAFMLLFLRLLGGWLPPWSKAWWAFLVLGLTNNAIPFLLTTWAQQFLDSGLSAILTSTMPLFTILLAHFWVAEERLTPLSLVGTVLGFLGIITLVGPSVLAGLGAQLWAQLGLLAAALSYAIAAVYLRKMPRRDSGGLGRFAGLLQLTSAQYVCSSIVLLPFSLALDAPWTLRPTGASVAALFALAVVVTIVAVVVYFYLIEELGAGTASMSIYLIPINAVFWGALVLDEKVSSNAVVALLFILSGIGLVNWAGVRRRRQLRRAPAGH